MNIRISHLRRLRHLLLIAVPLGMLGTASGCYYDCPTATASYYQDPAYVTVQSAPPPVRPAVATRPPQPAGALWVDGHYSWRGTWVWVDGHWETPRAGFVWTAPAVVQVQGGFRYHPGYWRPGRVQAAPVYRQPGTVAVSVRPAATVVRQGGSNTVNVQGGTTAAQGGANTVTVQGGATTVQGAQPGVRSTVRVQGGTRTTVSPGTATPTVRVQGGTSAAPPATVTPTVRVQGGTRTTAPGAVTPRVQGPNAGTRTTGNTTVTVPTAGTTATVQGGTRGGNPGTATVNVGGTRGGNAGAVALTCRVNTQRAPRGGTITLTGTGFGRGATVRIGGNIAVTSRGRGGQLHAQVPRNSAGGMVSIQDGGRRSNCGQLQVIGR